MQDVITNESSIGFPLQRRSDPRANNWNFWDSVKQWTQTMWKVLPISAKRYMIRIHLWLCRSWTQQLENSWSIANFVATPATNNVEYLLH